jgi:hypothetical protein
MKGIPKPPRSKEHCEKISKRNSGKGNPMYNQKHTEESLIKMHNAQLGNTKKLGYRFPPSIRKRMSEERRGENSPQWKGGVTALQKMIRESFEYDEWMRNVFTRDNFICQKCLNRGGYLNVHHIKKFSTVLKENNITSIDQARNCHELWDINNGITLCVKCHKEEHFGKQNFNS